MPYAVLLGRALFAAIFLAAAPRHFTQEAVTHAASLGVPFAPLAVPVSGALAIIGGLFVLEAVSVIVQVLSFRLTGKRVFKMAPLHHHFEQLGWTEPQIVIRFWIISIILALVGLATLKLR